MAWKRERVESKDTTYWTWGLYRIERYDWNKHPSYHLFGPAGLLVQSGTLQGAKNEAVKKARKAAKCG